MTNQLTNCLLVCYYMAMDRSLMLRAFEALDAKLKTPVHILVGGGAAMLLAHGITLSTMDIDGLISQSELTLSEIDPLVKKVAKELSINPHWFNSYFSTFTYTIPSDYKDRLIRIFNGKNLIVSAFGLEDLLIMKCFSGREKDIGHARMLVKKITSMEFIEGHIQKLKDKGVPGADSAMDFFDDILDQIGC